MTLDDALRLDVRALLRWLEAGPSDVRWSDGVLVMVERSGRAYVGWPNGAAAGAWREGPGLVVSCAASGVEVREQVRLVVTPCGSGSRPWAECPGCGSRGAVLYAAAPAWRFRCRACTGLAYGSQNERPPARALRRARRLVAAQGAPPNPFTPLSKLPGERWATFGRKAAVQRAALGEWLAGEARATDRFWGPQSPLASVRERIRWGLSGERRPSSG